MTFCLVVTALYIAMLIYAKGRADESFATDSQECFWIIAGVTLNFPMLAWLVWALTK